MKGLISTVAATTESGGEGPFDSLALKIVGFCETVAPYAYVLAVIAVLVVGIMFALPSDKAHEKAKSYGGWAIVGTFLIAGCVTIGKAIAENFLF